MLRSSRYNAAIRLLQDHPPSRRNPFFEANKFISVNTSVEDSTESLIGAIIRARRCSLADLCDGDSFRNDDVSWPSSLRTLAVKDNITTTDSFTTCASSTLKAHASPFEATVVTLLRAAGVKVNGKTNLDEFGMGSHSTNSSFGPISSGTTPARSVGGSSGGSAIAVASGLSQFALGTDTGGSVRLPAAYTGVVGFKPSYGLISRRGVIPYANSLDTVGILAPSVEGLSKILYTLRHHDPLDPTSVTDTTWKRIYDLGKSSGTSSKVKLSNITIGVPVEYNIEELDPEIRRSWAQALTALKKKGCNVVPVSLPNTKHALSAYYVLAPAEAASNLAKYDGVRYGSRGSIADGAGDVLYSVTRGQGFGDEVKRRILLGSYTLSASAIDNYFLQAQRVRRLVQRDFDRVFKAQNPLHSEEQFDITDLHESIPLENKLGPTQVDFIVCPTAPTLPPTLDDVMRQSSVDSYMNDVFTVPASLAGLPAISLPLSIETASGQEDSSLFAGIQVIGQYASDFSLLKVSQALERTMSQKYSKESKTTNDKNSFRIRKIPERSENLPLPDVHSVDELRRSLDSSDTLSKSRAKLVKARLEMPWTRKFKIDRGFRQPSNSVSSCASFTSEDKQFLVKKYVSHKGSKRGANLINTYVTRKGNHSRPELTSKEADKLLESALGSWQVDAKHKP